MRPCKHEAFISTGEAQGCSQAEGHPWPATAASSDADNEAYMQEFEAAFQQLSHSAPHPPPGQLQPPAQQHGPSSPAKPAQHPSARRPAPSVAAADISRDYHAAAAGWRTGPVDAAGVLVRVSERPLMCSATMADGSGDVVVGSSDHALYVVNPAAGCRKRTLYSKSTGHTEWVTCVCCLRGGRVLSGGMDGRLWLWPAAGTAGAEVKAAHDAPVSKVAVLQHSVSPTAPQPTAPTAPGRAGLARTGSGSGRSREACAGRGQAAGPVLAVSCSYDKTVKVWDVSGRAGKLVSAMSGHAGPVLELAVAPGGSQVLTGDRRGNLMCWDVSTASSGWGARDAHAGHVTALTWQLDAQQEQLQRAPDSSTLVLSGGQDGCLRVWDGRSGSRVAQQRLHASAQGKGAIGGIVTVAAGGRQLVVTAGADQTLKVADPATSYSPVASVQLTDFPYSLAAVGGGLVACGCGDGSVHVVDVAQGVTLYALGAGQAAVRALEAGPERLICSGDDGCVVAYSFV